MANLKETNYWEEGIYQFETSDPVMGGETGIDNKPTRQLANRTQWLKKEVAALADKTQEATNQTAGIAKLNNTLNSEETDAALTAAKGKELNDKITNITQKYLPLTGGTINGNLLIVQSSHEKYVGAAINNTNPASLGSYLALQVAGVMRGGIEIYGNGNGSYRVALTATANGNATDRHEHVINAGVDNIWTRAYG